MSNRSNPAFRLLIAAAMLVASLAALVPATAAGQSDRGLISETSYQSPQFGYTVDWGEPWEVRDRDVLTNPGGFDTITLRSLDGVVRISGRADSYDPLTFLQDTIAIQLASGGEVINLDSTAAVPTAELQLGLDRMRLDVVSLPESDAVVLMTLRADERDYEAALSSASASIQVAGSPVFSSAVTPAPATEEVPATPDAVPTLPVFPTEQAAPTQAAPTEAIGTAEPPVESTQDVLGGGIEGNTYTSPNFGFSIEWDPAVWSVPENAEHSEPGFDILTLDSPTGAIWVTGWTNYNGNAATCLLGEQTYYNDPELGISNWEVAVDAEGNELTGREDGRSWGVFTNTYTNPETSPGESLNYVDYIECVSLGDGESVVIFYSFAERSVYNEHIANVLAISESLELPGEAATPASPAPSATAVATLPPTQTPVATEALAETPAATEPAIETPAATEAPAETPEATTAAGTSTEFAAGDTVSGTTYPYSFTVPVGWQVSESSLGGDIERTVLINGTSTVAVEARAISVPTLSDCVTSVAGEHEGQTEYSDLALARTASGDPFSGEDDFSAFANFTFTGPDGETWSHFVECRWIVEGESALIVTQDVPQELFGSERAARRQIQNSIEVGE